MRTVLSGLHRALPVAAVMLAISACFAGSARAMTAEDQGLVERGLDALYVCDYEGAERAFAEPMKRRPDDPLLSLGLATALWWRMENAFALPGSPEEKAFAAAVDKAVEDAKHAADEEPLDAEAHLYKSAAFGLRGRWAASRRRWLSAYLDGRRAYRAAERAVSLDPGLYDAYLGLGVFDYYVATLSRFVRALTFTRGGGKEKGLAELELASRGRFSGVAAKLLMASIDWTFENKPREAWDILDELYRRYPGSPLIGFMRLVGLFHLRDGAGLEREARSFLGRVEGGAPFFLPTDRAVGRGFLGLAYQLQGDPARALQEYDGALKDVPAGHRWRSALRLFTGEALDLSGRRYEAEAAYRQALQESPLWGVPQYARYLLKRPFRLGDNPLPSRHDRLP